jgi:hypothetical protein
MTPSGWGDDARGRDAGHDEMQARVYREWLADVESKKILVRPIFGTDREFVCSDVIVEKPFTERSQHSIGRLLGFADVAVGFLHVDARYEKPSHIWWWVFFEIKPVIYSVGAVIRQCIATEITAHRAGIRGFDVNAVVYADDPKADLLKELHRTTILIRREGAP